MTLEQAVAEALKISFALALGRAGRAPRARELPGIALLAQDPPDRKAADVRQAVTGVAQGVLQRGERPGRGTILGSVRSAAELSEDALTLTGAVLARAPTTVTRGARQHPPRLKRATRLDTASLERRPSACAAWV